MTGSVIRSRGGRVPVLLLAAALLAFGCRSSSAPDSGFLSEPERMTPQARFPFQRVWVKEGTDWGSYTKIVVPVVNVQHLMVQDWARKSSLELEKIEKGANGLARYMHNRFRSAIYYDPNRRFSLVEQTEPNTVVLEMAIVEVVPNDAVLGSIGVIVPVVSRLGENGSVAMEARVRDGATREILAMFADREEGRGRVGDYRNATWWGHSEEVIDEWADQWIEIVNTPPDHAVKRAPPFKFKPW